MGVSSVPSTSSSSATTSSIIVPSTAPAGGENNNNTQHPPIVHAIGGAVGSALAILLFYPLERVRIELQSNVAGSCGSNSTASGENNIERENDDDDTNILHRQPTYPIDNLSNENNVSIIEGVVDNDNIPTAPLLERSPSPSSYEIISSVKSASLEDAASLGTLSDEAPLLDDSESSTPLVVESEDSEPSLLSSSSEDDGSTPTTTLPRSATTATQQQQRSNESMKQCLIRLYTEKSLYKGATHMVLTWMISNAIFFYALQVTRDQLSSLSLVGKNEQLNMKKSLLASTIAGCINVVLTNPLWVACVRVLEAGDRNTTSLSQLHLWTVMYQISHKEGIGQLWNGTATSLLLVSNPIIQHFVYEQLRSWFIKRKQTQLLLIRKRRSSGSRMKYQEGRGGSGTTTITLSPMEAFLCGALSKALATGLTYPLQLAQTLLRSQKKNKSKLNDDNESCYTGTLDCLCKQYSVGGIPALFYGMNTKMLQTCLTAAFQFVTYESILTPFGRLYAAMK
jgi:adenine nucleotide transporter 17